MHRALLFLAFLTACTEPVVTPVLTASATDTTTDTTTDDGSETTAPDTTGGCTISADCLGASTGQGFVCIQNVCVPQVCKPGSSLCGSLTSMRTCKSDGSGYEDLACGVDMVCEDALCKAVVCEPGSKACQGNTVVGCNARGTGGSSLICGEKEVCVAGTCVAAQCKVGQVQCVGGQVSMCKSDGSGWDAKACDSGQVCSEGACVAKVCEPGATYCDGSKQMKCDTTGASGSVFFDCFAISSVQSTCSGGVCVPMKCVPGATTCDTSPAVATCKSDGSGWEVKTCDDSNFCTDDSCGDGKCISTAGNKGVKCGEGKSCQAGLCVVPAVCQAGQKLCNGAKLETCNASGTAWDSAGCDDGNVCTIDGCSAGACTAVPGPASMPESDDFTVAVLESKWKILNPDATGWSLTAAPGHLRIEAKNGEIWAGASDAKNVFTETAPSVPYEVVTRLLVTTTKNYEQAGLLLMKDTDNYIKLVRVFDTGAGGSTVSFCVETAGSPTFIKNLPYTAGVTWLKLSVASGMASASFSANGVAWTSLGSTSSVGLGSIGVGAWSAGAGAPVAAADFDYVHLSPICAAP